MFSINNNLGGYSTCTQREQYTVKLDRFKIKEYDCMRIVYIYLFVMTVMNLICANGKD